PDRAITVLDQVLQALQYPRGHGHHVAAETQLPGPAIERVFGKEVCVGHGTSRRALAAPLSMAPRAPSMTDAGPLTPPPLAFGGPAGLCHSPRVAKSPLSLRSITLGGVSCLSNTVCGWHWGVPSSRSSTACSPPAGSIGSLRAMSGCRRSPARSRRARAPISTAST